MRSLIPLKGCNMGLKREVNEELKFRVVRNILRGDVEKALEELSEFYGVETPRVKVGMPKGRSKALGCYVPSKRTIYLRDREAYYNPVVVLHEFYHHLRTFAGEHRGSERLANFFAYDFLRTYLKKVKEIRGSL